MNQKRIIRYEVNENTFSLTAESQPSSLLKENCLISIRFPSACPSYSKRVRFSIEELNAMERWIISDRGKIRILSESADTWKRFLGPNSLQFVGLIAAALISKRKEDFLWIESNSSDTFWLLSIVWRKKFADGMLVERRRPRMLPRDYFLTSGEERNKYAKEIFDMLWQKECGLGLPSNFPFVSKKYRIRRQANRNLAIKLDPSETWFLLFPIDHFCKFRYGHFAVYEHLEWIVTSKTFIQNTLERDEIQKDLSDVLNFVNHSAIVINTYPHFNDDPKIGTQCRQGTEIVQQILGFLQNMRFQSTAQGESISIRWFLNPKKTKLLRILQDPSVSFFFADFHVRKDGVWQLGENTKGAKPVDFPVSILKGKDLSHIRFMHLFHCYSVFDPYLQTGGISIVRQLLETGVSRVEGSMMQEEYLNYLCSLLRIMCSRQGLQFCIMVSCIERNIDYSSFMKKVSSFLESCGWDAVFSEGA